MSDTQTCANRRQLAPLPKHCHGMMGSLNLGVQTCSPSDSGSGAGAGAPPIGFVDAWLRDEMERCYGRVLDEPVPADLLALLENTNGLH